MSERRAIAASLDRARQGTLWIAQGLGEAELRQQYDPELSPIGWHLGHIAWQKEIWGLRGLGRRAPLDPRLDAVFDAFRGPKQQRGERIPSPEELAVYAARVHAELLDLLERSPAAPDGSLPEAPTFRFLANHERQHAEIIAAVRLAGELPLGDPQGARRGEREAPARQAADGFVTWPGGTFVLGSRDEPEAWDNELPAHSVSVPPFSIARRLVSAGEWLEFMRAGGYADDRWWSDAGRHFRAALVTPAPRNWRRAGPNAWQELTLAGPLPVDPARPVAHVSFYEAEAFARFAGARLPTEVEWELAASLDPATARKRRWPWGDDAAARALAPRLAPAPCASAAPSAFGLFDAVGSVWQWTASAFGPYPGFRPQAYEGYSVPWFDGAHRVVRGGSYLTAPEIGRCCFRNWYLPSERKLPIGVRLARAAE